VSGKQTEGRTMREKKKRKCRLGHEKEKGRRGEKLGSPWLIMIALQLKSTLACSPDGRSMGTEAAAQRGVCAILIHKHIFGTLSLYK